MSVERTSLVRSNSLPAPVREDPSNAFENPLTKGDQQAYDKKNSEASKTALYRDPTKRSLALSINSGDGPDNVERSDVFRTVMDENGNPITLRELAVA